MPPSAATDTPAGEAAPADPAGGLAVATAGLTKRFGDQAAVDGIDLAVPRGAVYGFLGPNGSGKTTTIRMLLGLVRPTSGSAHLLGHAVPEAVADALPRVGTLVEGPAFHPHLSGRRNLARLDALDRTSDPRTSAQRIDAALDRVGLLGAAGKRYRAYSLGMRQRLALAGALLRPRDLLVLDEPTNGLDPQGTREVRTLIGDLAADGVTVLVSSHLLSEIEQVCTHLGVMRSGHLVAQGRADDIRAGAPPRLRLLTPHPDEAVRVLTRLGLDATAGPDGVTATHAGTAGIARHTGSGEAAPEPEAVVAALVAAGVGVREFTWRRPRLEERFIELTGEGFDVR